MFYLLSHGSHGGGRVAEWLGCWTSSPWVPGSNPTLSTSWICFSVVPSYKPSAALVYSQLVCLPPVGIFKHVMFYLQYLFRLFVKCSAPLAICYKHLPRVNKGYLFIYLFIYSTLSAHLHCIQLGRDKRQGTTKDIT